MRSLSILLALIAMVSVAYAGTETGSFGNTITITSLICPTHTSATATAMTINPGASSGTNIAGVNLTQNAGLGTGNALSGDYVLQSAFINASGSTVQSNFDADRICGKTTTLSTTTATATTLVSMSSVSNSSIGGMIRGVIDIEDGSNHVSAIFYRLAWSASNRAGTLTVKAGTAEVVVSDVTTFTALTTTVTIVASGTASLIKVTPSWTAGTPTIARSKWRCESYGPTVGTVQ